MATTAPITDQIYPLSTEDGVTIPLDVIRPVGLVAKAFPGSGVATAITIPAGWTVASFYSLEGCIIQLDAGPLPYPLADNIEYANTLLIPPGCVVVSTVIPGIGSIIPINAVSGKVYMQRIQKWSGIALRRQVNRI